MKKKGLATVQPILTALIATVITASAATAAPDAVTGTWAGSPLDTEGLSDCAAVPIALEVSGSSSGLDLDFSFGENTEIEGRFIPSETAGVYTKKAGLMSRLGLSDATTRDRMIAHERLEWARDTEAGIVIYAAQITEVGGLSTARIALDPVDGGIVASIDLDSDACRVFDLTVPLFPE